MRQPGGRIAARPPSPARSCCDHWHGSLTLHLQTARCFFCWHIPLCRDYNAVNTLRRNRLHKLLRPHLACGVQAPHAGTTSRRLSDRLHRRSHSAESVLIGGRQNSTSSIAVREILRCAYSLFKMCRVPVRDVQESRTLLMAVSALAGIHAVQHLASAPTVATDRAQRGGKQCSITIELPW